MNGITTYEIRDAGGELQALHDRWETPSGKRFAWHLPGAKEYGLQGRRVDSLPAYRSEHVTGWHRDTWIVVTEGESDCDALAAIDVPALGAVTGANAGAGGIATPTVAALSDVASGRRFVLWPDNDDPGRAHMAAVGANLDRAGARDVRTIVYRPTAVPLGQACRSRPRPQGAAGSSNCRPGVSATRTRAFRASRRTPTSGSPMSARS